MVNGKAAHKYFKNRSRKGFWGGLRNDVLPAEVELVKVMKKLRSFEVSRAPNVEEGGGGGGGGWHPRFLLLEIQI